VANLAKIGLQAVVGLKKAAEVVRITALLVFS
jgi:hypothetical protein